MQTQSQFQENLPEDALEISVARRLHRKRYPVSNGEHHSAHRRFALVLALLGILAEAIVAQNLDSDDVCGFATPKGQERQSQHSVYRGHFPAGLGIHQMSLPMRRVRQ